MKKKLTIAILFGFIITITNVCWGQDTTVESQKWIIGRWENATCGDILDVSQDSLRFLKNGLVFSKEDEEDWSWDYPKPESIDDLEDFFVNREKVPFEFGYHFDSIQGQEMLSLAFDYEMDVYPFDRIKSHLYLDSGNNKVYYYLEDRTKVVLEKISDLISEKQLLADFEEKEQQLSQDLASNGYGWLHGQWKQNLYGDVAIINIDSASINYANGFEEQGNIEIEATDQFPLKLHNVIESNTIRLALIPNLVYVDKEQQSLYGFYDFDQRVDYTKVSEYTEQEQLAIAQKEEAERQAAYRKSQIIKYSIWAGIGIVGIVLLLLLVRWIKKLMPKIKASATMASDKAKEKAKEASDKAKEKAKVVSEKAKESKDKLVDKSKELMEKGKAASEQSIERIKTAVEEKGDGATGKKSYTPWLIALLGIYSIIFFDIYIGLLLLIPAIIYLVVKKVKPEKAEQLVDNIKEKLQPITSKPMLKHGLIALLMGIVILRTLGVIPGWIIIGLSVVFLALTKFAPAIAQKIDDGCAGLCDKLKLGKIWQNNWVKVAVFALLLLVPILGVGPGQSVYSISQTENTSNTNTNKGNNSNQNKSRTATFTNEASVLTYLYSHTFRSSDGTSIKFKSYAFYQNGREVQASYKIKRYNSMTAFVVIQAGIYPIDVYVYGAEGHIIQDGTMYFAQ